MYHYMDLQTSEWNCAQHNQSRVYRPKPGNARVHYDMMYIFWNSNSNEYLWWWNRSNQVHCIWVQKWSTHNSHCCKYDSLYKTNLYEIPLIQSIIATKAVASHSSRSTLLCKSQTYSPSKWPWRSSQRWGNECLSVKYVCRWWHDWCIFDIRDPEIASIDM